MSFNGSGTFVINTAGQPVVSGTVISSTAFNALTADLATGLSTCITKDGQTTVTANIPMGNNKITGLAVGTAATDAANLSQVQSTAAKLINSVSGADTITGTMSPTLASYAAGQMFYWVAAGDNTGAVTLNIDSLGAKSVTRDGSVALAAGDIKSGEVVVVVYDGTRFQVVSQLNSAGDARFANVSIASTLYVGGVATFTSGTAAAPAITTAGDTNTGIFFPAADTIAFAEGGVEALRIDSSANVGIGTASPACRLHVDGQEVRLNASSGPFYSLYAAGTREFYLEASAGAVNLIGTTNKPMVFGTNNAERARITSGGDFIVGGTSTLSSSRITSYHAGNCHFATRNTAAGAGQFWRYEVDSSNDLYIVNHNTAGVYIANGGTSWSAVSDERLKTNLVPIENAAEKVSTLRAVTGRYKTDEEDVSRAFLIAQDVQAVLPEAVNKKDDDIGTLGLAYTETIPLLVAAIKELKAELDATKTRVAALEAK